MIGWPSINDVTEIIVDDPCLTPSLEIKKHGVDCPRCKAHNLMRVMTGESFVPFLCQGCGNAFLYFPATEKVQNFGATP